MWSSKAAVALAPPGQLISPPQHSAMSPAPTRIGSPSAVVTGHVKSRALTRRAQTRSAGAGDFHLLWPVLLRPPHVQSVGPFLRVGQGLPASRTLLRSQHALQNAKLGPISSKTATDSNLQTKRREVEKIAILLRLLVLAIVKVANTHKRLQRAQLCRVGIEQAPMRLEAPLRGIRRFSFVAQKIPVIDPVALERVLQHQMRSEPLAEL